MGLDGLEPSTSRLSSVRSNQLSYRPDRRVERVIPSKLNKVSCVQVSVRLSVCFLRKEVIQPQVLLRLPCYDFTLIICPTLDGSLPKRVTPPASGVTNSHGVTGGVYKARERIHRGVLIRDYWRFRLRVGELQPTVRTENGFKRLA